MAIKLTWTDSGVEAHISGDFPNQMVALNKALTSDPRSRQIRTMLIDVLDASVFIADAKLLNTLAEIDASAYAGAPRMRVAVVTDNAAMVQIVTVYSQHYRKLNPDGASYRVFADKKSAEAWLVGDGP